MKKIFLTLFLLTTYPLFTNHCLYAGWVGITKTPSIEGQVIDATTGKPIENVLISCSWFANYLGLAPDTITGYYTHRVVITNKEGKYKIPGYTKLRLGSRFLWIDIGVSHPLYESKSMRWPDIGQPDKDGVVHYNIQLLSLEEKYNKSSEQLADSNERKKELAHKLSLEFNRGFLGYFKTLKARKIDFNTQLIFQSWEHIVSKFSGDDRVYEILRRDYKNAKKEIVDFMNLNELK